ncbi:MAG: hypothetical protein HY021_16285 [Burkholderiales bacterium]|nr:hypothetical protein [Burkholderiales bacterium]
MTDVDDLSDTERAKIRAEVRSALVAAHEARAPELPKTPLARLLGYLSNGFVLLLVGSLITSVLVPYFQRNYDSRTKQTALMQDCLAQFLLYSNSLWQEYYAVLPLTQKVEIDEAVYLQYLDKIAEIKLKRYDAYAKVQALQVVFQDKAAAGATTPMGQALRQYAIDLNTVSSAIDHWLTGLYCTPTDRMRSPCARFDPAFDAYGEHEQIKALVVAIGNKGTDDVAAAIVQRINEH